VSEHATSLSGVPRIDDAVFALFQRMIAARSGIHLGSAKKNLLVGRLARRLRELNLDSFAAYFDYLQEGGEEEEIKLLDAICTNETHFFRDPRQFAYLAQHVFAQWNATGRGRTRPIRIWSAACSTGEEPFSIAMSAFHHLPGVPVEIVATDLSTRALARAAAAKWPVEKASEIGAEDLERFMLRGVGDQSGVMRACRPLREVVRFSRLNLYCDDFTPLGTFDLVFCRNVLIYFSAETRRRVVDKILQQLSPDGWLFLGHAESLGSATHGTRTVAPAIVRFQSNPQPSAVRGSATVHPQEREQCQSI
jgi:chemotaxis protein methyltransferase CheR